MIKIEISTKEKLMPSIRQLYELIKQLEKLFPYSPKNVLIEKLNVNECTALFKAENIDVDVINALKFITIILNDANNNLLNFQFEYLESN